MPTFDLSKRSSPHRQAAQSKLHRPTSASSDRTVASGGKSSCACGGGCPRCLAKSPRKGERASRGTAGSDSPIRSEFGAGSALQAGTLSSLESRLGHDFSAVRLHTGAAAQASAARIGAHAYAVGSDIVFGAGRFAPATREGERLLVHELAHVVQQGRGGSAVTLGHGLAHERQAHSAAHAYTTGDGPVRVEGATQVGLARDGPVLPAVTAAELMDRLVLAVRGFASSPPGVPDFDPAATGAAIGRGYETYAAIQIIDAQGNQVITGIGAYLGGGAEHAEASAVAALRRALPPGTNLAGARLMVVVDQVPCKGCASALESFAKEMGLQQLDVYVPTRPRLYPPGVTPPDNPPMVGGKTAARTFTKVGCAADVCQVSSSTYSGKPQAGGGAAGESPPADATAAAAKAADTGGAAKSGAVEPAPATAGGAADVAPGATSSHVRADMKVISSVERPGGVVISEVEVLLGDGLQQLNKAAPEAGRLPGRMVLQITQSADGSVTAARSLGSEPAALAEAFARQLVPRGTGGIAAGEAGGEAVGAGAAEGAAGASRGMTALFRGLKIGGWVVFTAVTGYQLIKAQPSERPRVLAGAAGGLAGSAAGTYLVCNLALGIETVGWSLLICGFVAGGVSGYAGSKAGEAIYDEATMTELDRALQEAEKLPLNVRLLLYATISGYGRDGVAVSAELIRGFGSSVPANLKEYELYILAGQLQPTGRGDSTESVLKQLRQAIDRLPERRPKLLPPLLTPQDRIELGAPPFGQDRLRPDLPPGLRLGPYGAGPLTVFPDPALGTLRLGVPDAAGGSVNPLLQINLLP